MKNLIIYISICLIFISCSSKNKYIPENELSDIIVQSVVTESFLRNTNKLQYGSDTLNFYLPIIDKYGYTVEDVQYTISRMIERKSDVFGILVQDMSARVDLIKKQYEYLGDMGRNWRSRVKDEVIDTLFFSPDSIRITSYKDLKMLDYKLPVNEMGEIIVKYNYRIFNTDSNNVRYMTYAFQDSVSKEKQSRNNYWLNKGLNISRFEKSIPVNSRKSNIFDMRILSYTSKDEFPHHNSFKRVDFYVDSVMILFRPLPEIGSKRLLDRISTAPIITDIHYLSKDSLTYVIPYNTGFGMSAKIDKSQVRYSNTPPVAEDPVVIERRRKKEEAKRVKERKRLDEKRKIEEKRRSAKIKKDKEQSL